MADSVLNSVSKFSTIIDMIIVEKRQKWSYLNHVTKNFIFNTKFKESIKTIITNIIKFSTRRLLFNSWFIKCLFKSFLFKFFLCIFIDNGMEFMSWWTHIQHIKFFFSSFLVKFVSLACPDKFCQGILWSTKKLHESLASSGHCRCCSERKYFRLWEMTK